MNDIESFDFAHINFVSLIIDCTYLFKKKIFIFCAAPPELITKPILTILGLKWPLKNGPKSMHQKCEIFKVLHCENAIFRFISGCKLRQRRLLLAKRSCACGNIIVSKNNTGTHVTVALQ